MTPQETRFANYIKWRVSGILAGGNTLPELLNRQLNTSILLADKLRWDNSLKGFQVPIINIPRRAAGQFPADPGGQVAIGLRSQWSPEFTRIWDSIRAGNLAAVLQYQTSQIPVGGGNTVGTVISTVVNMAQGKSGKPLVNPALLAAAQPKEVTLVSSGGQPMEAVPAPVQVNSTGKAVGIGLAILISLFFLANSK